MTEGTNVEDPVTKTLQIRLYASNLPRRRRGLRSGVPSTYCAVTSLSAAPREATAARNHGLNQALLGIENEHYSERSSSGLSGQIWGKTEVIQSQNPQWTKCIFLEYTAGTPLYFYVHVFAADENHQEANGGSSLDFEASLGSAAMEVSDILGTEHSTKVKRLRKGGCIFCRVEVAKISLDHRCRLQFSAELYKAPRSIEAWVEVSKATTSKSSSTWLIVHRSHVLTASTSTLAWDAAEIDLGTLCNGDLDKPVRLAVMRKARGSSALVGVTETTLRHLLRMTDSNNVSDMDLPPDMLRPNELFLQQSLSQQRQKVGKLSVLQASLDRPHPDDGVVGDADRDFTSTYLQEQATRVVDLGHLQQPTAPVLEADPRNVMAFPNSTPSKSFQDYIREGCVLDMCVAIDYTSSNGDPTQSHSLHYQSSAYNDYEEAILAICTAIDLYSSKEHSVWGFGAKFEDGIVRHLFQCGPSAKVIGTQGVLDAYRSVFQSAFVMSGPTILHKVLQKAALQAQKQHAHMTNTLPSPDLRYTVLLIITDGVADEFEETQRKLAVFSEMPLSVVIVGVGNSTNFAKMHELSRFRAGAYRPNATFLEFRDHQHEPSSLGAAALKNIPDQLCEYMRLRGF